MGEGSGLQDLPVLPSGPVRQSGLETSDGDPGDQGKTTSPQTSLSRDLIKSKLNGWRLAATDRERWLQTVLNNVVYYLNEPPDYQQNQTDYALPSAEDKVCILVLLLLSRLLPRSSSVG